MIEVFNKDRRRIAVLDNVVEATETRSEEKLHLLMLDDHIPAGAKMY